MFNTNSLRLILIYKLTVKCTNNVQSRVG